MPDFIIYYLIWWYIIILFYRLQMPVHMYNKIPNKFTDKLTNCEFCMESHLSLAFALIYYYFSKDINAVFYYFMCPALSNILKR
jgi:hypothetical protein